MSVSDTLFDAVNDLDRYMREDNYTPQNNLDMHIMSVRDQMELLRCRLDANPVNGRQPTFRIYSDNFTDDEVAS